MSSQIFQLVQQEITSWPGVTTDDDHLAGMEFRLGYRELGHIHGTDIGHLPLPPAVRNELITSGKAMPHPMFPNANWVEVVIDTPESASELIRLFRINYDRFMERQTA